MWFEHLTQKGIHALQIPPTQLHTLIECGQAYVNLPAPVMNLNDWLEKWLCSHHGQTIHLPRGIYEVHATIEPPLLRGPGGARLFELRGAGNPGRQFVDQCGDLLGQRKAVWGTVLVLAHGFGGPMFRFESTRRLLLSDMLIARGHDKGKAKPAIFLDNCNQAPTFRRLSFRDWPTAFQIGKEDSPSPDDGHRWANDDFGLIDQCEFCNVETVVHAYNTEAYNWELRSVHVHSTCQYGWIGHQYTPWILNEKTRVKVQEKRRSPGYVAITGNGYWSQRKTMVKVDPEPTGQVRIEGQLFEAAPLPPLNPGDPPQEWIPEKDDCVLVEIGEDNQTPRYHVTIVNNIINRFNNPNGAPLVKCMGPGVLVFQRNKCAANPAWFEFCFRDDPNDPNAQNVKACWIVDGSNSWGYPEIKNSPQFRFKRGTKTKWLKKD